MFKRPLQGKSGKDYSQLTMPSRLGAHRGLYTPITADEGVIYAKVDKGKKFRKHQAARGAEMIMFPQHTSCSSSSSVREGESDAVSVETPLVTSEDGRSSSNSEESKCNKINSIKYDDRESQV